MSIALGSNNASDHRNGRSEFVRGISYRPIYASTASGRSGDGDCWFPVAGKGVVEEPDGDSDSESSSSSIGRNSDDSSAGRSSDDGDVEVQSAFKGGAFDSLDALEEVLPVRKGISNFYCGKSKSFTSLADAASCSSTKDIVKPENAYSKRRRNLFAYSNFRYKNRNIPPRNNNGGISKKLYSCSRSALALAVAMSSSDNYNNGENSKTSSPSLCLPPLHPHCRKAPDKESSTSPPMQNFLPWRSFSLSDLHCAAAATSRMTGHND